MSVPPPVICCAARVCCDSDDEAREALATAIYENEREKRGAGSLSKEDATRTARFILDNFDLAPKGSLEKLIDAYRPLFHLAGRKHDYGHGGAA